MFSLLITNELHLFVIKFHFVGNKAKGRISKRVFQENKALTCAYQGVRNVRFSEILACIFDIHIAQSF